MIGERGVVHALFDAPALWRAQCAGAVTSATLHCGHFMAEELSQETADELLHFFAH